MGLLRKGVWPHISTPLGMATRTEKIQKGVSLEGEGQVLPVDLIWLPMEDFDLILGMDWLTQQHHATTHCRKHLLLITKLDKEEWFFLGDRWDLNSQAQKHT